MQTICGADCGKCGMKEACKGCEVTNGSPFGGKCIAAECIKSGGEKAFSEYKSRLMAEFNALGIEDMPQVTELYSLCGSFVNLAYTLPGGQKVRLWDDSCIYLGNQLAKTGKDRCYGLTADDNCLLVCEYGENGADPEIVVFKRRNQGTRSI
jgi:hypothetical protein